MKKQHRKFSFVDKEVLKRERDRERERERGREGEREEPSGCPFPSLVGLPCPQEMWQTLCCRPKLSIGASQQALCWRALLVQSWISFCMTIHGLDSLQTTHAAFLSLGRLGAARDGRQHLCPNLTSTFPSAREGGREALRGRNHLKSIASRPWSTPVWMTARPGFA